MLVKDKKVWISCDLRNQEKLHYVNIFERSRKGGKKCVCKRFHQWDDFFPSGINKTHKFSQLLKCIDEPGGLASHYFYPIEISESYCNDLKVNNYTILFSLNLRNNSLLMLLSVKQTP